MYRNTTKDIINALTDNLVDGKELSPKEQDRIARLKDAHTYWLGHPVFPDTMIRDYLVEHYNIGRTQAYDDIAIIKASFGNVQAADKEFQRFRANQLLESAAAAALAGNDKKAKALTKIAEAIAKVNRLDENEGESIDWDELAPKDFSFTVDPSVLGIEKEPNIERKARKLLQRYNDDIDLEEKESDADRNEISE